MLHTPHQLNRHLQHANAAAAAAGPSTFHPASPASPPSSDGSDGSDASDDEDDEDDEDPPSRRKGPSLVRPNAKSAVDMTAARIVDPGLVSAVFTASPKTEELANHSDAAAILFYIIAMACGQAPVVCKSWNAAFGVASPFSGPAMMKCLVGTTGAETTMAKTRMAGITLEQLRLCPLSYNTWFTFTSAAGNRVLPAKREYLVPVSAVELCTQLILYLVPRYAPTVAALLSVVVAAERERQEKHRKANQGAREKKKAADNEMRAKRAKLYNENLLGALESAIRDAAYDACPPPPYGQGQPTGSEVKKFTRNITKALKPCIADAVKKLAELTSYTVDDAHERCNIVENGAALLAP